MAPKKIVPSRVCADCRKPITFGVGATDAQIKTLTSSTPLSSRCGYCRDCFRKDPARIENAIHDILQRVDILSDKVRALREERFNG